MAIPTPEFLNIVAEATKRANGRSFDEVDVLDKDGNEKTMETDDFFDLLTDTFLNRRVMEEEVSKSDNPLITTRSMAFSLNAINNINMAGKIKWHIDDIVNHLDSDTVNKYGEAVGGEVISGQALRPVGAAALYGKGRRGGAPVEADGDPLASRAAGIDQKSGAGLS